MNRYQFLKLKEMMTFFISFYGTFLYFYENSFPYYNTFSYCLLFYFFVDFLNQRKIDMIVHHLLSICLVVLSKQGDSYYFYTKITRNIIAAEVSTIPFTLYTFLSSYSFFPMIKIPLQIIFLLCFFYFRIVRLTNMLLFDKEVEEIVSYFPFLHRRISYFVIFSLYNLNLYWFSLILNKVVVKRIRKYL
jgi:hypothetical protein